MVTDGPRERSIGSSEEFTRYALSELEQLRHLLADQANADHNLLLAKLDDALHQATVLRICPVCEQSFTQLKTGRIAQYCSAACKQKAYRNRRDEAMRRVLSRPSRP